MMNGFNKNSGNLHQKNERSPHKMGNFKEFWICKPVDMSRGRNIFLVDDMS